jgi:Tfp pilus assembly protein PilW
MTPHNLKDSSGFTLVELLVGISMTLIITFAAVSMFNTILHRQPESTQAADVIGMARNASETITAELRRGAGATLTKASELTLKTSCEGKSCEPVYACAKETGKTTYSCSRTVGTKSKTLVTGLSSGEVFCVYPTATSGSECGAQSTTAPRYVGIKLEFPSHKGATATTILEDGAALHNLPEALEGR